MKIVVYNLGCKVNQYESDGILTKLASLGYEVSDNLEFADCYILNTCAVTNEAEKKSRQAISRCLHFNKDAKIIVCGCASQHNSAQFEGKNGVTYIGGVANKNKIPELLEQKGIYVTPISKDYGEELQPDLVRTRAYVKIQDGCNNFCSYCIIPYLRGRSRSRSIESIVNECERLQNLTNEIVLTGIDMSSYGLDIGTTLSNLILNLSHINVRIRFGSLEARVISEEFLQNTKKLQKFCPHFHLSLQSGDDNTLKNMNRKYTSAFYAEKVALIRQFYPTAAITTDLICGFPTESDSEFENTLRFVSEIKFSDIHIFAYSKREGTVAAKYKMLDGEIVKRRTKLLEEIAKENKAAYYRSFIGKTVEVLVEIDGGYTREYVKVKCDGQEGSLKQFVPTFYDEEKETLV